MSVVLLKSSFSVQVQLIVACKTDKLANFQENVLIFSRVIDGWTDAWFLAFTAHTNLSKF